MATPLLKRFGTWLGVWRGRVDFSEGRHGIMQFTLKPIFNGEAIQVETIAFGVHDSQSITRGWGYLSLDRSGRVINNIYGSYFGFAILHETPDDPEVLSLQGNLPGNEAMDVTMSVADDVFTLSSMRTEGYQGSRDRPRTYTLMRRVSRTYREES